MEQKSFGKLADGEGATLYTISNTKGMCAQITDFGAAIVSLVVKDKNGKDTDVVLGYEDAQTYQQQTASFGAIVGRNCNRIADAQIVINDVTYQLERNDNENNLHSGSQAYVFVAVKGNDMICQRYQQKGQYHHHFNHD